MLQLVLLLVASACICAGSKCLARKHRDGWWLLIIADVLYIAFGVSVWGSIGGAIIGANLSIMGYHLYGVLSWREA